MSFKLDKHERNLIIGIFVALAIYFGFLIDKFYLIAETNITLYYIIFLIVYASLVLKYIFEINLFNNLRILFAWAMVYLAGDTIFPPILIDKITLPTNLPMVAKFSSDIFIYNLMPDFLPHIYKYYGTYVLIPSLLLIGAAWLLQEGKFQEFLRKAL